MDKNLKYHSDKEYTFKSGSCTKEELDTARKQAKKLMPGGVALRSCWLCNAAHYHFLNGDWGKWVLCCFECGKYFYNKIDITEYGGKGD